MEKELYETEADWFNFSESDLDLFRELEDKEQIFKFEVEIHTAQKKLRADGNFAEAERLENFTLEEWKEWKEKEKQRVQLLEEAVKNQKK